MPERHSSLFRQAVAYAVKVDWTFQCPSGINCDRDLAEIVLKSRA